MIVSTTQQTRGAGQTLHVCWVATDLECNLEEFTSKRVISTGADPAFDYYNLIIIIMKW